MLTIQPIMNSIDGTNGVNKQPDDFQSIHFNADDDFGDFTDFQENATLDDDFGDFTFFQSGTNVNNIINNNIKVTTTTDTTETSIDTTNSNTDGADLDGDGGHQIKLQVGTKNDEFGDFTYFQTDNCDNVSKSMDDDDFGDFTSFQSNDKSRPKPVDSGEEVKDSENLNFFSNVKTSVNSWDDKLTQSDAKSNHKNVNGDEILDDNDDFGDFATFQETRPVIKAVETTTIPSRTRLPSDEISFSKENEPSSVNCKNSSTPNSPLSSIVCQSFAKGVQDGGNKIISTDLFPNTTSQSYKMWQSLINWEEAASLKLNWESSHTFQVFLRSLKIDSKNIQRMPCLRDISTPLIPSKLTILQPTPLLPSIIPLEPQVSQLSQKASQDSTNNSLTDKPDQQRSASTIPEASFDWNSSGLTNPLEKDWLILL